MLYLYYRYIYRVYISLCPSFNIIISYQQPTVEAFFLVHSPVKSPAEKNSESDEQSEAQEESISNLNQSTSAESNKGAASVPLNIPVDQQKFLQFAGTYLHLDAL